MIGGNSKTLYEIGPTQTINGNVAYRNKGNSPWCTSNVYAKVSGVVKGSNAVYPAVRSGSNKCAKLCSQMENVKVLGLINMDVMVAGSIFLGQMMEPITSTKNPYSKMDMGVAYTKKPKAVVFDYKLDMPATNSRVKSTGFGSKKHFRGMIRLLSLYSFRADGKMKKADCMPNVLLPEERSSAKGHHGSTDIRYLLYMAIAPLSPVTVGLACATDQMPIMQKIQKASWCR